MYAFPYAKEPYIASSHKYVGCVVMVVNYLIYLKACHTDPGKVTKENHSEYLKRYPFDNTMFKKECECYTCKFDKPARSKHRSMCEGCIMRFDHHCVWINGCVGLYNYRWFLAFLVGHWSMFIYCIWGGLHVFKAIADDMGVYSPNFVKDKEGFIKSGPWHYAA
jgi:palmitoyltransferase ZDHHC4